MDLHNFPQPGKGGAQAVTIPHNTQVWPRAQDSWGGEGEGREKSPVQSLYKEVTEREASSSKHWTGNDASTMEVATTWM